MPEDPNNQDNFNQTSEPEAQPEHETHTAALVFLVLSTIIISFVALTWDTGVPITDDDQSTTTEQTDEPAHGSIVPQQKVDTTETNSLTGFPQDLYINESTIIDNKTAPTGDGSQYMVAFTEDRPIPELQSEYKTYLQNNDFSIHQEMEDQYGAKLAASSAGQQLTISITENGSVARVMLDYVTSN